MKKIISIALLIVVLLGTLAVNVNAATTDSVNEIYAIGFDDYIFSDAVSIIEWANYIEEILPKDFLHIYIEKDLEKGEDYRKITITPYGERYDYINELKI